MRNVVLIGTSHKHQLPENSEADAFCAFIRQLYATKAFQAIAEEMSLEELANRHVTRSICTQIANELGVCHQYCDPDKEQRSALGLRHNNIIKADGWLYDWSQEKIEQEIKTSHSVRERYWLEKLLNLDRWPVLFVCGACHVKSFRDLAEARGLSVDIALFDWKAVTSIMGRGEP
jgi:hypothetical protein